MGKSSKEIVDQRIEMVMELLLTPESSRSIVRFGSTEWKVSTRQVQKYIKIARVRISETIHEKNDLTYRIAWHVSMRQRLLKMAIDDHEVGEALSVLDSLAKLEGLFDPELQEKLKAETELFKKLSTFPLETALKILSNNEQ